LPRKYRPPAARRRKSKRPQPYFVDPLPTDGDVSSSAGDEAVSVAEPVRATPAAPLKPSGSLAKDGNRAESAVKHMSRDYSYVRSEVKRIVLVAGFLVVSLIIIAVLRN
jgi:hypothetical protein